jgi:DNA-binding YbaB/EbfC family protein
LRLGALSSNFQFPTSNDNPRNIQLHEGKNIMFENLKNLGNPMALLAKAREMQEKMQQLQEELGRKQVSADAGGGMVEAVVNGRLEVVKVRIDKSKVDVNDTEMIEDLIVAAINAAQTKASAMMKEEMTKIAGGLGVPPGMLPG